MSIEISRSGTESAPITIAGYPGERPVIDGQYQRPGCNNGECDPVSGNCFDYCELVVLRGSHIIFEGFEVKRSTGDSVGIDGDHGVIRDSWIHHSRGSAVSVIDGDYAVLEDSKIWLASNFATYNRSASELDWPAGVVCNRSDGSIVRNNEIYHVWGEGLLLMNSHDFLIEDNVIYDNYAANLYLDRSGDVTIQRNLVYSTNDGVFLRGGNPTYGIGAADELHHLTGGRVRRLKIVNNLVMGHAENIFYWGTDSGDSGLRGSLIAYNTIVNATVNRGTARAFVIDTGIHRDEETGTDTRIENNIILQDDGSLADVSSDSHLEFSYNLWSRPAPDSVSGPGDVIGDPRLTNPNAPLVAGAVNADWYKLQVSSPAIGAARVVAEVAEDFFGNIRGNNPDMGALEYDGSNPSTLTPITDYPAYPDYCEPLIPTLTPRPTLTPKPTPTPTCPE